MWGRLDINAALPRVSEYVKTFLKDWERLSGSGRFDLNRLKEVMMLLVSNDGALAPEWLDHPLKRQLGWLSRVPFRWRFPAGLVDYPSLLAKQQS